MQERGTRCWGPMAWDTGRWGWPALRFKTLVTVLSYIPLCSPPPPSSGASPASSQGMPLVWKWHCWFSAHPALMTQTDRSHSSTSGDIHRLWEQHSNGRYHQQSCERGDAQTGKGQLESVIREEEGSLAVLISNKWFHVSDHLNTYWHWSALLGCPRFSYGLTIILVHWQRDLSWVTGIVQMGKSVNGQSCSAWHFPRKPQHHGFPKAAYLISKQS